MKKIILLILGFFFALGLTSCDSEQSVSILDENGEEVQVQISKTDDEEVVKNALTYVSQASYGQIEGLQVKSNIELGMAAKLDSNSAKLQLNLTSDAKFSNQGLSAGLDLKFVTEEVEDGEKSTDSQEIGAKLYYDVADEKNLYAAIKTPDTENKEMKVKVDLEEVLGYLMGMIPGGDVSPLAMLSSSELPGDLEDVLEDFDFEEFFAELNPEQIMVAIESTLPNSKLEISQVNSQLFTLRFKLSANDILSVVAGTTGGDSSVSFEKDFFVNLDFSFGTATGKFAKFAFEFKDVNAIKSIIALEDKESAEFIKEFNLKLAFEVTYNPEKVDKLSTVQKLEYLPLPIFG